MVSPQLQLEFIMEQYLKLWATPVAIFNHPDFEAINAEIMHHDEVRGANFNSWYKKDLWDYKDSIPALQDLHGWMLECTAKYASDCFGLEYHPEYFYHGHGSINHRGRGDEAPIHTHRLTTVVLTYYVDVHDDCGDIRLLDPRSSLGWISLNDGRPYNQYTHKPKNGEMIMFPGWVTHAVMHNKTDKERVAITSNMHLKDEFKDKIY
jgi:uncharacterized protein (TIGR02466 family)